MAKIIIGGGGGGSAPPPALDPDLDDIAALTPADDDLMQRKAGEWTNRTPAQVKTDLALGNVDNTSDANKPVSTATATALAGKQPLDADLTAIAGLSPAANDFMQYKAGAWANRTVAQVQTDLGVQAADADLTAIAALSPADDSFIQRKAGVWAGRTLAQVRTDLHAGAQTFGTGTTAAGTNAVAEGNGTSAAGTASHAEGDSTSAAALYSHAEGVSTTVNTGCTAGHAEGGSTLVDANYAHAEGFSSQAAAQYSHAGGKQSKATRSAQFSRAAGQFAAVGDAQENRFVAMQSTTNATPAILTFGGGALNIAGAINVLTIPVSRAHMFRVSVIARRTDVAGEAAGWEFKGVVARDSSGSARIVGTPAALTWGDAGAALWDITLSIDTTDATLNYLKITATGEAAKTIRWVATIDTAEVG